MCVWHVLQEISNQNSSSLYLWIEYSLVTGVPLMNMCGETHLLFWFYTKGVQLAF